MLMKGTEFSHLPKTCLLFCSVNLSLLYQHSMFQDGDGGAGATMQRGLHLSGL